MRTVHQIVFVFLINCSFLKCEKTENGTTFEAAFQWTYINFTWPSNEEYQDAITTEKYVPENNAIAGIKFYNNKIYIAMPRIRSGAAVTLGYISSDSETTNPLITPFPDWDSNDPGDCSNLQSVQSMEIDKDGIMWVLDGVRTKGYTSCPPKLILFDLKDNGKVIHAYNFTEQVCASSGGFLNDIVIDDSDGGFAYITEHSSSDPGLIVYSRRNNEAWKLRDPSMFADLNGTNFVVDGLEFTGLAAIDGIALAPADVSGVRYVYYCPLAGFNLYSISTEILKSREAAAGGKWRAQVNFIGKKQAQSDGLVVDSKGDLYYGLLPLYGVGKWNICEPFVEAKIVDENRDTMIWTDSFTLDDKGYLYLLANNIHKFFNPTFNLTITDEPKFRILKLYTGTKSYLH